jgi:hypothetical protein
MFTSRIVFFVIMLAFAVSVFFEVPFIVCALISGSVIGFTMFLFFMCVHMVNFFKSPVEKRRNSDNNTDKKHKGSVFGRYILQGVSESVDKFLAPRRSARIANQEQVDYRRLGRAY